MKRGSKVAKSKYLSYSKTELENYVQNYSSIEDILVAMGYSQTRDSRIISNIRSYFDKLEIAHDHIKDTSEFIECNCCKQKKSELEFYFSNGKLVQKVCKSCVRKNEREKYHSKQEKLIELKKTMPCKKCGCQKHYLIDFHHIDPAEKNFTISKNPHAKFETLLKEIEKCIPLCSNCHREFHYLEKEQGITLIEYLNGGME